MSAVEPIVDYAQFGQEVKIGIDLDAAFRDQAGLFAYYAHRAHLAARQFDRFEISLKVERAKIGKELRDEAATTATKITEAAIEQAIMLDRRYQTAQLLLNDARGIAELAKGFVESLKQRRDMLIQLGANEREERKGDAVMRGNPVSAYSAGVAERRERELAPA